MAAQAEVHMEQTAPRRLEEVRTVKDAAGWPYRFAVIPIKQMIVDAYQRPLTSYVEKIEKQFDPALLGVVVLSQRKKTEHALVDGQTRAEAARRVGLQVLPAVVYEGLTFEQEAELFAKFQTERRRMHSVELFNAQVHAKLEPQTTVANITKKMGFRIDVNPGAGGDRKQIAAPVSLVWVYQGCTSGDYRGAPHKELLESTLEVMAEAWPNSPAEARSAAMIKGLGYFLKTHGDADVGRLIDRLGRVMPSELAKRATALREGHGANASSPKYMAEAIESQYNRMVRS